MYLGLRFNPEISGAPRIKVTSIVWIAAPSVWQCFLCRLSCRSPLHHAEARGWQVQHLLRVRPHQTQPADPPSGHQPGGGGSHPLHVLAALLLHAQIRWPPHPSSPSPPPTVQPLSRWRDAVSLLSNRSGASHHPLHLGIPAGLHCVFPHPPVSEKATTQIDELPG